MTDWRTKEDKQMTIENMSDSHLLNAIRYAKRHPGWRVGKLKVMQA